MPLASSVSGKWFEFPKMIAASRRSRLTSTRQPRCLVVRTAAGVIKTADWNWIMAQEPDNGFANGLIRFLSVPEHPLVAASGAWSANDVFNVKLVLYQTPFYSVAYVQV